MKGLIQFLCAFAIAIGLGVNAFGTHIDPSRGPMHYSEQLVLMSSMSRGVGVGLTALGILGLLLPLVSKLGGSMQYTPEGSLQVLAALIVWGAAAFILTAGVMHQNWSGGFALTALLLVVTLVLLAVTASMAMIYGWRPWRRIARETSAESQEP
ncbi:hypothetical protein [Planctomyces sp. SH-PL14]|uniref:hypothetical protein n=1 Tax=Planctomyces sp. SH-PL14 TaxID=1632864 RepID=UPI00078BD6A2|nr:hypothetical protein [Planctomyces sp. SH-PL14]AMV16458.1 hypothetical protein VT03_01120 [Planctomyces sp. SH-PL14]